MDKSIISLIIMIRDKHGDEVFANPEGKLLKTYLLDYAETEYKGEINCLCTAFNEGVYHELKETKKLNKAVMRRYIIKFEKLHFWNHDTSIFAVNTWAEFLGLSPLTDEHKVKPEKAKDKKEKLAISAPPLDSHVGSSCGVSIDTNSVSVEECFKNSKSWLEQAEKTTNTEQKQTQYQLAFLEAANAIRIYDSKKPSAKEYLLAFKRLKGIYKKAVHGQDKTGKLKFQAGLKSSALKAYIPKHYMDLSTRKYRYILMIFLIIISTFITTWGRAYTVDVPYISDRVVMAPYLVSVACMTYILWLFLPDTLKRLLRRDNTAFGVIATGALGFLSMFIHSQITLWLIKLLKLFS